MGFRFTPLEMKRIMVTVVNDNLFLMGHPSKQKKYTTSLSFLKELGTLGLW